MTEVDESGGRDSLGVLRERVERAPGALEATLAAPEHRLDEAWWSGAQVVVTGVGLAAGPARLAAYLLARAGVAARFEPAGAFACDAPRGQALCVFSQGLSPNARLAMSQAGEYERSLLVTTHRAVSCGAGCEGEALEGWPGEVWALPPDEIGGGMLIRVVAPICAALGAARLAARLGRARGAREPWYDELDRVPERYARALRAPTPPRRGGRALALVTVGASGEVAHGLMWKVMEGLWCEAPTCVDVLDFAHGPLQSLDGAPALVVALRGGAAHDELTRRLGEVLSPGHELAQLRASGAGPLAMFEHDAALNAWICAELEGTGRDLARWPARGQDGALYDVCARLEA